MSLRRLLSAAAVVVAVLGVGSSASAQSRGGGRPGGCASGAQAAPSSTSAMSASLYNRQAASMRQSAQRQAQWRSLQAQAYQQMLAQQALAQQQAYLQAVAQQQAAQPATLQQQQIRPQPGRSGCTAARSPDPGAARRMAVANRGRRVTIIGSRPATPERPTMTSSRKCAERVEDVSRELTDAELECVAAGKELGERGQGSAATRGWYGAGYGNERGYDSYGTHIG